MLRQGRQNVKKLSREPVEVGYSGKSRVELIIVEVFLVSSRVLS